MKKSIIRRLLVVLVLAIVITGCAAVGPKFSMIKKPSDKAVVYIYRKSSVVGSAASWDLFANGKALTRIINGGYYAHIVSSGTVEYKYLNHINPLLLLGHLLQEALGRQKALYTLDVVSGQEYFFRWKINWLGPEMVKVAREVGLKEIKNFRQFIDYTKKIVQSD